MNIMDLSQQFHHDKLTVINNLLPSHLCDSLVERAKEKISMGSGKHVDFKGAGHRGILDGGGNYRYDILEMNQIMLNFPELVILYHSLVPFLSSIIHANVIVSPHAGSEITLKLYQSNGGEQGWHYDTNALTALLYLTTNDEGATACQIKYDHPDETMRRTVTKKIYPQKGSLLLMKGREVWHCSEKLESQLKVVVPFNYYLENDVWRPEGIDNLIFGKVDKTNSEIYLTQGY